MTKVSCVFLSISRPLPDSHKVQWCVNCTERVTQNRVLQSRVSQLENRIQETRELEGSTSPVWTLTWSMRYVAKMLKKEVTDS